MKPDWDKLIADYEGNPQALVADVDCTTEGKALCETHGVRGYPSIKYGDPSDLQDYQGGRDYDALKKFAEENLKPVCSPANIDLCDDEKKAQIKKYQDMDGAALDGAITAEEKKLEDAEEKFKNEVQKLQDTYQKLMEEKDATQAEVKASGLGLMKSVKAAAAKANAASDEL